MFLSLLLNEFLQLCMIQKSRSVQDITSIIAVADELSGARSIFVEFGSAWFCNSNK